MTASLPRKRGLTAADRPQRARILEQDPAALADVDVVAFVLDARGRARGAAERVLARRGPAVLRETRLTDLAGVPGVGVAGAVRLLASVELGRRAHGVVADGPALDSPEAVFLQTRDLVEEQREHFAVLLLNTRHRYLTREIVSIGSLNASIVHPREVFRPAIRAAAAAIVLVHNHPSGDPSPSRDDVEITRRLVRVGDLVGIPVLDHVIVAGRSYFSMRQEGVLGGG